MEVPAQPAPTTSATEHPPVLKLVNRTWKVLPDKGEDVFIRDPKLKEGQIGDLTKKTIAQLEEIIERQDRILNNKFLSSKLKDKGKKLKECREMVAEALKNARKQSKSESRKDIPADINALEWKSRRKNENKPEELDSDDDEEDEQEDNLDPLKLMAYHSSCVKKPAHAQNGTIVEDEDPTDAIARELRQLELQDAQEESQACDFGNKRNQTLEEMRKRNGPVKDSFKPFRPVNNPQPIPGLMHHTARPCNTTTKTIPQLEALKLEREFLRKEKERALSNARQQLGKIKTEKIGLPPSSSSLRYRDSNVNKHLLDSEDESDNSDDYTAIEL